MSLFAAETQGQDHKARVVEFVSGFTVETTPGSAAKIADYREHLRPGAKVAVTFLPGSDFEDTIRVSKRLRNEGFDPLPHFAARSIPSKDDLDGWLGRLTSEAGVSEVVALGGAVDQPLGPFDSSMAMIETGLFDATKRWSIPSKKSACWRPRAGAQSG